MVACLPNSQNTRFYYASSVNSAKLASEILYSRPIIIPFSWPERINLLTWVRLTLRYSATSLTVNSSVIPMDRSASCHGIPCSDLLPSAPYKYGCAVCAPTSSGSPSCHTGPPAARFHTYCCTAAIPACPVQTGGTPPRWYRIPSCCCSRYISRSITSFRVF